MYWWVWAMHEGRPVIFKPPYTTEEEANQYGFRKLGSNFEVLQLDSRDVGRATSTVKRIIFEQTSNLDTALQRARHKLPDKEMT